MNAKKLSEIAIMIKTSIPGKIQMDPNGAHSKAGPGSCSSVKGSALRGRVPHEQCSN